MSQTERVFKGAVPHGSFGLKDIPKKGTLISNILNREDDQSLAVRECGKGIEVYWETNKVVHKKVTKDFLSLLSKDELAELFHNAAKVLTKENFSISMFKFEMFMPSKNKK